MTSLVEIVPAGNQLFTVTLEDQQGSSRHEVAVPDGLPEELLGDEAGDHSLQDVVLASLDWRLQRGETREDLPTSFSLADLRGVDDFDEQLPLRVRNRAPSTGSTHRQHQPERAATNADQRLIDQVQREQEAGEASRPRGGY